MNSIILRILKVVLFGVFLYIIFPTIVWFVTFTVSLITSTIGWIVRKLLHGNKKQYEVEYIKDGVTYTNKIWM